MLGTATLEAYNIDVYQPSIHLFDPVPLTTKIREFDLQKRVSNLLVLLPQVDEDVLYRDVPIGVYQREIYRRFNRSVPHTDLNGGVWQLSERPAASLTIGSYQPHQIEKNLELNRNVASIGSTNLASGIDAIGALSSTLKGVTALVLFLDWNDIDQEVVDAIDRYRQRGKYAAGFNVIPEKNEWKSTGHGVCIYAIGLGNEHSRSIFDSVDECGFSEASDRIAQPEDMADFVERILFVGPKDSDGDGVYNYLDLCEGVGAGRIVNEHGCLRFSGDGEGN